MTDSTLNQFLARGTQAQRVAFTPSPPTPASGPSPTYFWFETDTGDGYSYNGSAWVRLRDAALWKNPVRAGTTGALAANTYNNGTSGVGATLTANANGTLAAQDGVTLVAGDRLMVKNEATGANNGIYTVTQVGSAGAPYILTRATDADTSAELVNASFKISEGTTLADLEYQCTNNSSITVGTTALVFVAAGGGGGSFTTASTTEVLTGTDTSKGVTPDALAALWEQGTDVASAGTVSLGEGGYFNITGTTTITDIDFATDKAGRHAWVKFAGALTLTHNASTLILPGGANITTAAGDTACFISEGTDAVRCVAYTRASGAALVSPSSGWTLASTNTIGGSVSSVDFTGLTGTDIMIVCRNIVQASSGVVVCRVSVDNGSTYYSTSGDYIALTTAGVESNTAFGPGLHLTNTTAARSGAFVMLGAGVNGGAKLMTSVLSPADTRFFIASTSPINAVRVLGSAGNLTAGTIYVYTR